MTMRLGILIYLGKAYQKKLEVFYGIIITIAGLEILRYFKNRTNQVTQNSAKLRVHYYIIQCSVQ